MPCCDLLIILCFSKFISRNTVFANITIALVFSVSVFVRDILSKNLICRIYYPVVVFIIYLFPPFSFSLHCLQSFVLNTLLSSIAFYHVSATSFLFQYISGCLVICAVKCYTIACISQLYYRFQYKSVFITEYICFINILLFMSSLYQQFAFGDCFTFCYFLPFFDVFSSDLLPLHLSFSSNDFPPYSSLSASISLISSFAVFLKRPIFPLLSSFWYLPFLYAFRL